MLANGQTLVHKETRKLARLVPCSEVRWAWDIGKKTAFVAEDGTKFFDDIENYTHIEDELGRSYFNQPEENQFVDESAKKYLVSNKKMIRMRQEKLKEWEAEVLDRMENGGTKDVKNLLPGGEIKRVIGRHSSDVAGKSVLCPFADGSQSFLFKKFFLEQRKAVPLYRVWNSIKKEYMEGPLVFRHTDGQLWVYDYHISELKVIKEGSINIPTTWKKQKTKTEIRIMEKVKKKEQDLKDFNRCLNSCTCPKCGNDLERSITNDENTPIEMLKCSECTFSYTRLW